MKIIIFSVLLQIISFSVHSQETNVKIDPKSNKVLEFNNKYIFNAMSTYDTDLEQYISTRKGQFPVVIKFEKNSTKTIVVIEHEGKVVYSIVTASYIPGKYTFNLISKTGGGMYTGILTLVGKQVTSFILVDGLLVTTTDGSTTGFPFSSLRTVFRNVY